MSGRIAFVLACTLAANAVTSTPSYAADDWPSRPIHVIVPYPAGGIVDIVARAITEQVTRDTGQPVIVESRAGANTNIGTGAVAKSSPDGYTWLITGPAILVNPKIYENTGYDTLKDFKCVGVAVWNQSVALVHPSSSINSIGEFVEAARAKPDQLNFGSIGVGSSIDLTAQKLFQAANIKLTSVVYKGQPPALMDLMSNLVQFEVVSLALALPHIKNGTVKPLAVFTDKRVKDLPDVPTIAEAGFKQAAYEPWYGIYLPASTPDALVEKVHAVINKALENPDVKKRLAISDIPGTPMSLSDLAALVKSDQEKLTKVIDISGEPKR